MKYLFTALIALVVGTVGISQYAIVDEPAILILDKMSNVIGDLSSCSFRLSTTTDVVYDRMSPDGSEVLDLVTRHSTNQVYFSGSDKLLVDAHGDKGHRGVWYDGSDVAWYSYDENNFVFVNAPESTVEMMYALNERYEIDFPAADFFNPYLTDDLIATMDLIEFVGKSIVEGVQTYHVVAQNSEMRVEIWVNDDSILLPKKMRISYLKEHEVPRYEATFSDWVVNPDLPDAMFTFIPPPGARKIAVAVSSNE